MHARRFMGSEKGGVAFGPESKLVVSGLHRSAPGSGLMHASEFLGHGVFLCAKKSADTHSHLEGAVGMEDWSSADKEVGAKRELA